MVRVPSPAAPGRPELVRGLQERAAWAFPAEDVAQAGGWWLRRAPGCAWWVASVLPHVDAGPGELAQGGSRGEVLRRARHGRAVPDQPAGVPGGPRHAPGRAWRVRTWSTANGCGAIGAGGSFTRRCPTWNGRVCRP